MGGSEEAAKGRHALKNIVICSDGTRAEYGRPEENSNVVRLFQLLQADGDRQVSFYDPGIGTYSKLQSATARYLDKTAMTIAGAKIDLNIQEAYKYLMDAYTPGDKIFLFGYSRGAHTVRALAGMLQKCGLLTKGSDNLIPYATKYYRGDGDVAKNFRDTFSRPCTPHFIGVWDTVASIGWLWWRKYFNNLVLNPEIPYAYQALSIDEDRKHFRPAVWDVTDKPSRQTIEQVWFPGFHADVGGQKANRGISDITLAWMMENAEAADLKLKPDWPEFLNPDPSGELTPAPQWVWFWDKERRTVPTDAKIHQSAFELRQNGGNKYWPKNLPM